MSELPTLDHQMFKQCVDDSSDAIMLSDEAGQLIYVNPAWEKIYGYTLSEVLGKTARIIRSTRQDASFYEKMWDDIRNSKKGFWKGEIINRSKSGAEVPVLLTITPYRDRLGTLKGYMGIAIDLTEKKELESEVMQQDRLATIGFLASGLSHEIGTPLGVIRGRAEYLQLLVQDKPQVLEGLTIITEQIDRISKLIYSLLHLARAEKTGTIHAISLLNAVENVLTLLTHPIKKLSIKTRVEISPAAKVMAETDRLGQVLLNLMMNAIHAMEMVTTRDHRLEIVAFECEEVWILEISDTGNGMSKETLKSIFNPFFTTKPVGKGTGLGLTVVLRILESWGAKIDVRSEVDHGTTFSIELPKG